MPENEHSGGPTPRSDRPGNSEQHGSFESCSLADRDAGAVQAAKILLQGVRAEIQEEDMLSPGDSRGSIAEPPRRLEIPPATPQLLPAPVKVATAAEEVEMGRRQVIRLALDRMVKLNVYDLDKKYSGLYDMLHRQIGLSIFHVGVEVFGMEYMFAKTSGNMARGGRTGVVYHLPRRHDQHHYKECIWLGRTMLTPAEVKQVLQDIALDWPCADYDLATRNCVHFANELTQLLGVGQVPSCFLSSSMKLAKLNQSVLRIRRAADLFGLWNNSSTQHSRTSSPGSEATTTTRQCIAAATFVAPRETSGYSVGRRSALTQQDHRDSGAFFPSISNAGLSNVKSGCDQVACSVGWATAQVSWGDIPLEEPLPASLPITSSSSAEEANNSVDSTTETTKIILAGTNVSGNSDIAVVGNDRAPTNDATDKRDVIEDEHCHGWRLDRASTGIGASTMSSLSSQRTSRSSSRLLEYSPVSPKDSCADLWAKDQDNFQQVWSDVPGEPEAPGPPPFVGASSAELNMTYL